MSFTTSARSISKGSADSSDALAATVQSSATQTIMVHLDVGTVEDCGPATRQNEAPDLQERANWPEKGWATGVRSTADAKPDENISNCFADAGRIGQVTEDGDEDTRRDALDLAIRWAEAVLVQIERLGDMSVS